MPKRTDPTRETLPSLRKRGISQPTPTSSTSECGPPPSKITKSFKTNWKTDVAGTINQWAGKEDSTVLTHVFWKTQLHPNLHLIRTKFLGGSYGSLESFNDDVEKMLAVFEKKGFDEEVREFRIDQGRLPRTRKRKAKRRTVPLVQPIPVVPNDEEPEEENPVANPPADQDVDQPAEPPIPVVPNDPVAEDQDPPEDQPAEPEEVAENVNLVAEPIPDGLAEILQEVIDTIVQNEQQGSDSKNERPTETNRRNIPENAQNPHGATTGNVEQDADSHHEQSPSWLTAVLQDKTKVCGILDEEIARVERKLAILHSYRSEYQEAIDENRDVELSADQERTLVRAITESRSTAATLVPAPAAPADTPPAQESAQRSAAVHAPKAQAALEGAYEQEKTGDFTMAHDETLDPALDSRLQNQVPADSAQESDQKNDTVSAPEGHDAQKLVVHDDVPSPMATIPETEAEINDPTSSLDTEVRANSGGPAQNSCTSSSSQTFSQGEVKQDDHVVKDLVSSDANTGRKETSQARGPDTVPGQGVAQEEAPAADEANPVPAVTVKDTVGNPEQVQSPEAQITATVPRADDASHIFAAPTSTLDTEVTAHSGDVPVEENNAVPGATTVDIVANQAKEPPPPPHQWTMRYKNKKTGAVRAVSDIQQKRAHNSDPVPQTPPHPAGSPPPTRAPIRPEIRRLSPLRTLEDTGTAPESIPPPPTTTPPPMATTRGLAVVPRNDGRRPSHVPSTSRRARRSSVPPPPPKESDWVPTSMLEETDATIRTETLHMIQLNLELDEKKRKELEMKREKEEEEYQKKRMEALAEMNL